MDYQTDNVFEAIWVGCAMLSYSVYSEILNKGNTPTKDSFWFTQTQIQIQAQQFCAKVIQPARLSQWTNADHTNNSYNYLRANGKLRRLTARGELRGNKEVPEELSQHSEFYLTISEEKLITIGQLTDWVNTKYTGIILGDHPQAMNLDIKPQELKPNNVSVSESKTETQDHPTKGCPSLNLISYLSDFLFKIKSGEIEVYNEFSVQFELAIFLRARLDNQYKIQLERNISLFDLNKSSFLKREMDIVIFDESKSEKYCIEIKYPNNGQYPEQMFSICKDIKFLEQLQEHGFSKSYELVIVSSDLYYINKGGSDIYDMFRKDKLLRGRIIKPTGRKDEELILDGKYRLNWIDMNGELKALIIPV
ncbi:Hypothetical protein DPCES_0963 [Desulfitobacterium hafniense]|uniref:Uncharacterized protein n=1 Tax=Desulfitobacterium hafniense TaxID=49338 RepID=A0A098AXK7_DESHA|nr:hypothetical protein [Desulfitobacterium hafniense]CDX00850.1 Hypothetical protein DPCES_0963 [Desulfitobacterium hafniense]